tara:strand:+ start:579 stop:854 length:276 start_codon:yes stop_codon:yes gene_type:complete
MVEINDLIDFARQKDFSKADNVFNELMKDKLSTALDQEKIKIAGTVYNDIDPADMEPPKEDEQLTVAQDEEEEQVPEEEDDDIEDEPDEAA